MKRINSYSKKIIIGLTFFAIVLIITGIFSYYNFFRQHNASLIEAVPPDAAFIFKINDEELFLKNITHISPYLNEIFSFDAFIGSQSFIDKISIKGDEPKHKIMISGHRIEEQNVLLYSATMGPSTFKDLLKTLRIDSRNCLKYEKEKIYSYGTHFKKFYFVCHHNIFSVSESLPLLKKSISQHKQLQNLVHQEDFKTIYEITEKNNKQNWLFMNHELFISDFSKNLNEKSQTSVAPFKKAKNWSAYQISFTETEMELSGYMIPGDSFFVSLAHNSDMAQLLPLEILPFSTSCYQIENKEQCPISFFLHKDSLDFSYGVCPSNNLFPNPESLFPSDYTQDSSVLYKDMSIYRLGETQKASLFEEKNITPNYFIYTKNYFICSDSINALKYYIDQTKSDYTLEDLPLFRLSQNNLPSSAAYQVVNYFHNDQQRKNIFAADKLNLQFINKISIFAISMDSPQNGISATKIYIKF